jgi:hypothetical protein
MIAHRLSTKPFCDLYSSGNGRFVGFGSYAEIVAGAPAHQLADLG